MERQKESAQKPAPAKAGDIDARWTKKNNTAFYGYKNHVNIDRKHKLIRKYKVTDASVHDSQELDSVLDPSNDSQETWADSAYRSEQQEARLQEIMRPRGTYRFQA